jgi:hypothetical protein
MAMMVNDDDQMSEMAAFTCFSISLDGLAETLPGTEQEAKRFQWLQLCVIGECRG